MVRYRGESYGPGDPEYPHLLLMMCGWAAALGVGIGIVVGIALIIGMAFF